jgi:hypothetical protein
MTSTPASYADRYEWRGTTAGAQGSSSRFRQSNQGNGVGNGNFDPDHQWGTNRNPYTEGQDRWESAWFNTDWPTGNGQGNGQNNQGTGNGVNNGQGYGPSTDWPTGNGQGNGQNNQGTGNGMNNGQGYGPTTSNDVVSTLTFAGSTQPPLSTGGSSISLTRLSSGSGSNTPSTGTTTVMFTTTPSTVPVQTAAQTAVGGIPSSPTNGAIDNVARGSAWIGTAWIVYLVYAFMY